MSLCRSSFGFQWPASELFHNTRQTELACVLHSLIKHLGLRVYYFKAKREHGSLSILHGSL